MLCVVMLVMVKRMMIKSYNELILLPTFEERFEYLRIKGFVGETTFGSRRMLNQILYKTPEWREVRNKVILRDNACDLGIEGRDIIGKLLVHHINPITVDDIIERNPIVFDLNNLISTSHITHEAIHYGDSDLLIKDPIERSINDTCPWRH